MGSIEVTADAARIVNRTLNPEWYEDWTVRLGSTHAERKVMIMVRSATDALEGS